MIDRAGTAVGLPRGASDAGLTAHPVARAKIAVFERSATHEFVDAGRVARAIELTRVPVPDDGHHAETGTEAGPMRAADLVGSSATRSTRENATRCSTRSGRRACARGSATPIRRIWPSAIRPSGARSSR